jgi:hypothetical protein
LHSSLAEKPLKGNAFSGGLFEYFSPNRLFEKFPPLHTNNEQKRVALARIVLNGCVEQSLQEHGHAAPKD